MPDFDDFSVEEFDKQFEEELQTEEIAEDDELETTPEDGQAIDEIDETEDTAPDLTEESKRNAAFAQMRRENEALAKETAWLKQLASENGLTLDEMREQYENSLIEKEAEEKGVPVDVLQRLAAIEQENALLKNHTQTQQFNAQVDATIAKYDLKQDQIEATFKYAVDNGLAEVVKSGAISFEAAYKLAHMDVMIEDAKSKAIQDDLAQKKKRQQEAPLSNGSTAIQTDDDVDAQALKDAKEILESGF